MRLLQLALDLVLLYSAFGYLYDIIVNIQKPNPNKALFAINGILLMLSSYLAITLLMLVLK